MNFLDDIVSMKTLDPHNVIKSTALFADQCEQAWKESTAVVYPSSYNQIYNVVVCGMGGSRFTPLTIKELFKSKIREPYEIVDDYTLPGYVDSDTLVILSSFSGSTEEVLSCAKQAIEKKTKLTAVASGGSIAEFAKTYNFPAYIFTPTHNPCGQPRIGGGYLLMGHMGLLKALHLLDISDTDVHDAITHARNVTREYDVTIPLSKNKAKRLAEKLYDRHPYIITSEFLRGFGNGFANQLNETAKLISDSRFIPELNHHLMEGLRHPETLKREALFLFIQSHLYTERIQKRFDLTVEIVHKQQIETDSVELSGKTQLEQVLEAFVLSGFTTLYLAMLYRSDPALIPWVNTFKKELSRL